MWLCLGILIELDLRSYEEMGLWLCFYALFVWLVCVSSV